ncbi:MAG: TonB family protein [Spirochaeta sp.]|nr:TonB family protein [Spirochaeta sp.]
MMRLWRDGKSENHHLVWAIVISLVLHAGIIAAVSFYTPAADSAAADDGRQLITTLEFGAGAAAADSHEADRGKQVNAEPERVAPAAAETENATETTEDPERPDSSAPTERVAGPEILPVTEEVERDHARDRAGQTSAEEGSRSAESDSAGLPDGVANAARPPRVELPRPLAEISPEYPAQARRRGIEGVVVIRVTISPKGEPVNTTIVSASAHAQLNEAAISAIREARFRPGTIDESPAEMNLSIRIVFEVS